MYKDQLPQEQHSSVSHRNYRNAIVDLVFDGLEEVVVADGVLAGLGRGPRDEHDPRLDVVEEGRGLRVAAVPGGPLLVPVEDLGVERVGWIPERPWLRLRLVVPGGCLGPGGGGGGGGLGAGPEIFVTDKAGYVDSDPGHGFEDIRE
ncbi:non-specific phospholipase C1 [Hordeum vulgare]|nr:non-specific phospholipase C1 [Hordeum vulgare]